VKKRKRRGAQGFSLRNRNQPRSGDRIIGPSADHEVGLGWPDEPILRPLALQFRIHNSESSIASASVQPLSPLLSITSRVRSDKWLIFLKDHGLAVDLTHVKFESHFFS